MPANFQTRMVIPQTSPPSRVQFALLYAVVFGASVVGGTRVSTTWALRSEAAAPLRQTCIALDLKYPPPVPRLEIDKPSRRLVLYSGTIRLKEYRVALGQSGDPQKTKTRQGDRQTPTGEYYVCTRLRRSRFHRFLGLSYPAPADAAPALRVGRITPAQHAAIVAAHRKRKQPPWGTPLGGAVGIHGGGVGTDWTAGCIALENSDIDELFTVLPLGTPVALR